MEDGFGLNSIGGKNKGIEGSKSRVSKEVRIYKNNDI